MKTQSEITSNKRLRVLQTGDDGGCGELYFPAQREPLICIWSWGMGWDHVSVSYSKRTPTWDEMCRVKETFFNDDETVVQYHPKKSEYKNVHEHCLHLWRKQGTEFELPPNLLV